MMTRLLLVIFLFIVMAASGGVAEAQSQQPDGWDASLKLVEAADVNPDPKIVEITLEARISSLEIAPGVRTDAWTYNGGLPGPLIRARRGDRLIVHFSNSLPQSTTVHWHGVQVPIEMDGVPGASQPPVEPGGTFTYDFVVPDAGLFWYHPHVMSAAQVGFGLYGPLLVADPEDPVKVADELVLVLSDIATDDDGKLHSADSGGVLGALLGREGNHVLVNGKVRPTLTVRDGALQRWRIVNAAKSRYFELVLGDGQPFELIGVDGGHMEYSLKRWTIVLGPGERADVLVAPRLNGQSLTLITNPFNRGFGSTRVPIGRRPHCLPACCHAARCASGTAQGHSRHSCHVGKRGDADHPRSGDDEGAGPYRIRARGRALLAEVVGARRGRRETVVDDYEQSHLGTSHPSSRVFLSGS